MSDQRPANSWARNFIRGEMRVGDRGFFYHSSCEEPGIVGIVEICRGAYPDQTQFDRRSQYHDAGSSRDAPRWFGVDVKLVRKTRLVSLAELRSQRALKDMRVLQPGNRLSIMPVTSGEWDAIMRSLRSRPRVGRSQ